MTARRMVVTQRIDGALGHGAHARLRVDQIGGSTCRIDRSLTPMPSSREFVAVDLLAQKLDTGAKDAVGEHGGVFQLAVARASL